MKMVTKEVEKLFNKFPLYSQDGKGDDAKVLVKFFNPYGDGSWYVLEAGKPLEDGDRELFVYGVMHQEGEYGYMMLSDFTKTTVRIGGCRLPLERDVYFSGTLGDAKKDAYVH